VGGGFLVQTNAEIVALNKAMTDFFLILTCSSTLLPCHSIPSAFGSASR